ncbi:hypothetical protein DMA11_21590 [Marinilabiliaceae bacterium JC017]|nr:hypothetical protein DMA11_21590 [Marinilabiliaceae bacterium JC017]
MTKFLIYMFESGMCLSLFYLGYIVFFRKETYFNFNRFYLLGSMILALTVPLISLPVDWGNEGYLKETANGVEQFRNYYEHLILLTDPDIAAEEQISQTANRFNELSPQKSKSTDLSLTSILFSIYLLGVLFFSFRLVYLLRGIKQIIVKANVRKEDGIKLVLIKDEVPPFSFLRWIFVNPHILKPEEYEQVLLHEKVHVKHKHTMDLLLVHIITIFHWFNPVTWRIQKSIKTCHEYIADREVVRHGHGLFDYQSLLLSQLISIRSVELVNNFNLLSIKKRITMMNKNKSGRWAQLKAIATIPLMLSAFFLFADMTNRIDRSTILDSNSNEAPYGTEKQKSKINLPDATQLKAYDKDMILCRISLSGNDLFVNDHKCTFNELEKEILNIDLPRDQSIAKKMTVLLLIDKNTKMKDVDKIKHTLRKVNYLKTGLVANLPTSTTSTGSMALFNFLPPKDAKWSDKGEFERNGITVFKIDGTKNKKASDFSKALDQHVRNNKKYAIIYKYDNGTSYSDYVRVVNSVYETINNIRREHAASKGENFDQLPSEEQKVFRKKYPMILTMKNTDID